MGNVFTVTGLIKILSTMLAIATPTFASAETVICSRFEFFDAKALQSFDQSNSVIQESTKVSDWIPGESLPNDVSRIVLAIPKSAVHEEFGCVEQAERIAPGVKDAIQDSSALIGSSPPEYDKIVIGKYSKSSLFGPITTKISYVRASSLVVQIIITSDAEPFRSVNAIERYYDLPLGYCEKNDNCGIEYGEP